MEVASFWDWFSVCWQLSELVDANRVCPGIHKARVRPTTRSGLLLSDKLILIQNARKRFHSWLCYKLSVVIPNCSNMACSEWSFQSTPSRLELPSEKFWSFSAIMFYWGWLLLQPSPSLPEMPHYSRYRLLAMWDCRCWPWEFLWQAERFVWSTDIPRIDINLLFSTGYIPRSESHICS